MGPKRNKATGHLRLAGILNRKPTAVVYSSVNRKAAVYQYLVVLAIAGSICLKQYRNMEMLQTMETT